MKMQLALFSLLLLQGPLPVTDVGGDFPLDDTTRLTAVVGRCTHPSVVMARPKGPPDSLADVNVARSECYNGGVWWAGDSVRFVIRFTPNTTADSIVLDWQLGMFSVHHTKRPPFPATGQIADTARFEGPPLSPGGSSATGGVTIRVWKLGVSDNGVIRQYDVVRAPPPAPASVGSVAFVDSAVVY